VLGVAGYEEATVLVQDGAQGGEAMLRTLGSVVFVIDALRTRRCCEEAVDCLRPED
jgi:hypothetical protein